MNIMDCVICQKEFEYKDTYGQARCPHCGQEYEYDEGQRITLTDRQLAMLRCEKDIEEIVTWAHEIVKRFNDETENN